MPSVDIDNRLEKPNQKLPRLVFANLARVLDVAVYNQNRLEFQANFKLSRSIIIIIIMSMIII